MIERDDIDIAGGGYENVANRSRPIPLSPPDSLPSPPAGALMGSISVTITRQPALRSEAAEPLPTSPKPQTTATLPAIITSVARRMLSTRLSRQPYTLSNLLLVTLSFTLMAGNLQLAFFGHFIQAMHARGGFLGQAANAASSCGYLSWMICVTSPPSSKIMFGTQPSGPWMVCSMHHQNSSSLSPFQAKTGIPAAAMAAAAVVLG